MHDFPVTLRWQGTTSEERYSKDFEARAEGRQSIRVSAAPHHGGSAAAWSPEDLLCAALSSCQLLTFMAYANKSRIDVRRYDENATARLDETGKTAWVDRIVLSPTIRVAAGTNVEQVHKLFARAHERCIIAASIKAEVVLEPRVLEEPMGD